MPAYGTPRIERVARADVSRGMVFLPHSALFADITQITGQRGRGSANGCRQHRREMPALHSLSSALFFAVALIHGEPVTSLGSDLIEAELCFRCAEVTSYRDGAVVAFDSLWMLLGLELIRKANKRWHRAKAGTSVYNTCEHQRPFGGTGKRTHQDLSG